MTEQKGLVLVVEDDAAIADLVALYLRREGFGVQVERDGAAGLAAVARVRPVAVVLDVGLPGLDGIEVCRRLRAADDWTPVLFVTARDEEVDRVLGLELGADDYVTKPFSPRELVARVRSVLRRSAGPPGRAEVLELGGVALRPAERRVRVAGGEIALTSTEFDLLAFFLTHPGEAFTREQLLEKVWGWDFGDQSTVTVHVRRLREKIEPTPAKPTRITTVWGVGYRYDRA